MPRPQNLRRMPQVTHRNGSSEREFAAVSVSFARWIGTRREGSDDEDVADAEGGGAGVERSEFGAEVVGILCD